MKLREVRKAKVLTLPTGAGERALAYCSAAVRHEQCGEYEAALEALAPLWIGPGTRPDLRELDSTAVAAVLLRSGSLTAWLGSKRQIKGWQELAKDLLTESSALAEGAGQLDLWLEAQKMLGVCYWREGAFDEARAVLSVALERAVAASDLGITLKLNLVMVERLEKQYRRAVELLAEIRRVVAEASDLVQGMFHNSVAAAHKDIEGDTDKAIIEITAACYHFERAGHKPYLIAAEINLSCLLVETNRVDDAHEHLGRAEALARESGDAVHLAQAKDSRALAYIAERNYEAAELAARQSVSILEQGDEAALLIDSLVTHARALIGCARQREALKVYLLAYELACDRVGSERASRVGMDMFRRLAGDMCLEAHVPFDEVNKEFHESVFRAALEATNGKVTAAALRLGMTHQNLSWLLKHRYNHLRTKPARRQSIIQHPAGAKSPPAPKK